MARRRSKGNVTKGESRRRNTKVKRTKKNIKKTIILWLIIMCIHLCFSSYSSYKESISLDYGELVNCVRTAEIAEIEARVDSNEIKIVMEDGEKKIAVIPSLDEFASFISEEIENGSNIEFIIKDEAIFSWKNIWSVVKPILIWSVVIMVLFASILSVSNINMDSLNGTEGIKPVKSKIKFDDVAGIEEEKEQLIEVVKFLKNSKKYTSIGAKIPKGILLNGEPGTGKTLLAQAIAGEADVPFFQMSASAFEEKYVGVGASRVRNLFKAAKKVAPAIIFIDEIDSVAKSRFSDGRNTNEQTLNQILSEMDGFDTKDDVIVIAATNRKDVLDPAILRPGRFDRQVYVPMPDVVAREKILKVHARNKKLSDKISIGEIAKKTVGFSGAELENLLNEAAIYAVNNGRKVIEMIDIEEAIARVLVGLEKKSLRITDEEKKLLAVHEAGHAIVSAIVRPNIKNLGISIVPRGNTGGYNSFDESEERYIRKSDLINKIMVCYGGRIAEEIIFNDISTGAANDLERATKMAYFMATKFAMNGSLIVKISSETNFNNEINSKASKDVEAFCQEIYEEVKKMILSHKDVLLKLASLLIEKEYLTQEEINVFMKSNLT